MGSEFKELIRNSRLDGDGHDMKSIFRRACECTGLLKLAPTVFPRQGAKLSKKMAEKIAERTSEKYLDGSVGLSIVFFSLHWPSTGANVPLTKGSMSNVTLLTPS
jgi:hypothetical protein